MPILLRPLRLCRRWRVACAGSSLVVRYFIDHCWRLFKLAIAMVLVAVVVVGVYLFMHLNDELRRHIEAELASRLPSLEVHLGGARLVEGRGIVLEDLVGTVADGNGGRQEILSIGQLTLVCDGQVTDLLGSGPKVQRVDIQRLRLAVERGPMGRWNWQQFGPLPVGTGPLPAVSIQNGTLVVSDSRTAGSAITWQNVNLNIAPQPSAPHHLQVHGSAAGPRAGRCDVRGDVDLERGSLLGVVDLQRFVLGEETLGWIRPNLPDALRNTRCSAVMQLHAEGEVAWANGGLWVAPSSHAELSFTNCRIDDPRLVRSLTDLSGRMIANGAQLRLEEVQGRWGDSQLALAATRNGWQANAPLALSGQIRQVALDRNLYQALPELLREQWDKYRPTGQVDAVVQATFDGHRWQPVAVLTGSRLAFESEKFRYRLTGGRGTLRYTPAEEGHPPRIDLDLVGEGGGQPLRVVGQIVDPRPGAAGWVEITGRDVEIEKKMIEALPDKSREVIGSLHPAGRLDVHWRVERRVAGDPELHKTLRLELRELSVNYDKFAYPLRGIYGTVTADNDHWVFSQLVSGGRRTVRCHGRLDPIPEGTELALHFEGEQTPLDDDLFEALPESVQRAWAELRPRGHVDFHADVYHRTGLAKPNIRAVIYPRSESALVKPKFFNYLMEKVTGAITYQDGEIMLENVRAAHNRTTLQTNGSGSFSPDGSWHVQLTGLTVDRVTPPHRDLLVALPRPLGKLVDQLRPTGSFGIHDGVLAFRKDASPLAPVVTSWDIQLDCHQTDLQTGIDLKNVHGSVQLRGAYDGQRSYSSGELAIDSLTFQDVLFTNVRGPIWVDESQCRFGRWATQVQQTTPRRITCGTYGGDLAADGWVTLEGIPEYGGAADIQGADLNRLIVERFGGEPKFHGKVDASLRLRGGGRQLETLGGEGEVHIRDANIYELPLMIGLLKMLRTGSSDTTAFDESDIKFRLQGKHIILDQLDFLGDVVNLYGKGYTNFDQELKLVFHTVVGRSTHRLPLVKSFVGKASEQFMQMYVDGTLASPNVTTEAFPGVNRLLEQIQANLASPPPSSVQR